MRTGYEHRSEDTAVAPAPDDDANQSVAGEEDPGAALDPQDDTASRTVAVR